ncbi:flavonoid 3',5'-hydroxylase-like [Dioscorea cayenensis subsp. rotundata]|uniref:Flavonoid 3',5'-hydroxylase-like n=1 Tax=Dioscorea cayennensis subsp. rotundata TaxID=55577 RepID=A0AB40B7T6_DIOCR|nr:flavonoid 3',5'-hydroxylase-like [Dioscorea cayenensis subsp. rotundata]
MMKRMLALHKAAAKEREGCPDFIDLVLASELRDDDGEKLSDVNIRALRQRPLGLLNMFTAGTDTSTIIVEWALAELIKNSIIMKRLQSEMDAIIGQERILEEDDISNLPYLQAVCKEALRLHASTPLSTHTTPIEPLMYLLGILVHGFNWKMPKVEEIDLKETPGLVIPKAVPIKAFVTPRLASMAYF